MADFSYRWYQNEAIGRIATFFENEPDVSENPIVALPTGTGKSPVQAGFIHRVMMQWPWQRFLCLTHSAKLVGQNARTMQKIWPSAPLGIYSAELKQNDTAQPIIFGGIQSVAHNVEAFGHRDIVFVDEVHMVGGPETKQYFNTIQKLREINPFIRLVGLTATAYRMKMGSITDGGIFTQICYDKTDFHGFNQLLKEGFMSPLMAKQTKTFVDTSKIKIIAGEFAQGAMQDEFDKNTVVRACCTEMAEMAHDRNCWLLFASGIEHAEHVAEMLRDMGLDAMALHSKLTRAEQNRREFLFVNGGLRILVNNGILTTGFDHPPVDFIGVLRATMSPGLWVQILGRGTRPYDWWNQAQYIPGFNYTKNNCLVADFGGNVQRLGPINDPRIPRKPGKGGGDQPQRVCPECGCYNHPSLRHCGGEPFATFAGCGTAFDFSPKIEMIASNKELIKGFAPPPVEIPIEIGYFDVDNVFYDRHRKTDSPDSVKVTYYCGQRQFPVWLSFESRTGRHMACNWWIQTSGTVPPVTTDEALERMPALRIPAKIRVHTNLKFPKVISYEY